jgi:serine/threonine-protein kinase HipA
VRRFDGLAGVRIHSISAGTAIRAGYFELARILRRVGLTQSDSNRHDARELLRPMVFNILIDNTDNHEKQNLLLEEEASKPVSTVMTFS